MTTIIRNHLAFERDFVMVPNAWVRDSHLSRRARGLLAELMSHVDGFEVTTEQLTKTGPEGRDAIRATLTELQNAGYLTRTAHRSGTGTFMDLTYELQDPTAGNGFSGAGTTDPGKRGSINKKTNSLENGRPKEHSSNARGHDTRQATATARQLKYLSDIAATLETLGELEVPELIAGGLATLSKAGANDLIRRGWKDLEHARFTGELMHDESLPTLIKKWLLREPRQGVLHD